MLVLGLDTALKRCSVAIIRGDDVLAEESVGMERGHAEHLAPMVAAALKNAGVKIRDLDRVGVVVGPGGFTGVRVALAFARGLGVATGVPVVGVTSLAAIAAEETAADLIAPVIDARRGQVYAAIYDSAGRVLVEPFVSGPKEALKIIGEKAGDRSVSLIGSGAGLLTPKPPHWSLSKLSGEVDALTVARLAQAAAPPRSAPAPLYLRPPAAKPGKPSLFERVSS